MSSKIYDMSPYLSEIDRVISAGPFYDSWESLSSFEVPDWFRDAKLGIFFHWGLYSVPARFNEWYSRNMYIQGSEAYQSHIERFGSQKDFGYKDFIPLFKAEAFDAEDWICEFKAAGARYIVPVAEHHDGFQMYRSRLSRWNSYDMGPCRDVLGELFDASRAEGLVCCCSNHRAEHFWFMGHGLEFDSDIKNPMERGDFYWPAMPERDNFDFNSKPLPTEEFLLDWLIRNVEIIDNYKPRLIYFDWWIEHTSFEPYLRRLIAYYYNRGREWGEDVAVCYKNNALKADAGIREVERGAFSGLKSFAWQTDTSIAHNSWCHTIDLDLKPASLLIETLIDAVSKNGNLLLNVCPRADGVIPEDQRIILRTIGDWLRVNGEAIYGTRPWIIYKEGPYVTPEGSFSDGTARQYTEQDIYFTSKRDTVYAIIMRHPGNGHIVIESLSQKSLLESRTPKGLRLLGLDMELTYSKTEKGLELDLPVGGVHYFSDSTDTELPLTIKIDF